MGCEPVFLLVSAIGRIRFWRRVVASTANLLACHCMVVAVLAIFTKASVGATNPQYLRPPLINPVGPPRRSVGFRRKSWGQRLAGIVVTNEDASKDPIVTNSGVRSLPNRAALRIGAIHRRRFVLASPPHVPASQFRAIMPREDDIWACEFLWP